MAKRSFSIFPDYKPPIIKLPKYKPPKINFGLTKGKDYTRQHLTNPDRWKILGRQKYKCRGCGKRFGEDIKPQYDHIKPVSRQGKKGKDLKNMQALCAICHDNKSREEKKKVRKPKSIWNVPSPRIRLRGFN
ncbi:HNH endonuclease [Candidatus Woesearchaeota archaeon]|nr:HNH endonuclease [Candidatus Woesearchaeota archaeon]